MPYIDNNRRIDDSIELIVYEQYINSLDLEYAYSRMNYKDAQSFMFACGILRILLENNTKRKIRKLGIRGMYNTKQLQCSVLRIIEQTECNILMIKGKSLTPKTLIEKARKFKKFGHEALLHKGHGNKNALKISMIDKSIIAGLKEDFDLKLACSIYQVLSLSKVIDIDGNEYQISQLSESTIRRFMLTDTTGITPIYTRFSKIQRRFDLKAKRI